MEGEDKKKADPDAPAPDTADVRASGGRSEGLTDTAEAEAPKAEASTEAGASETAATEPESDLARPEAIAKRVAALGEEDESERIARIEEAELAERRARQKKGAGKRGLEAAASKRLSKIGEQKKERPHVSRAVPADPVLQKTTELSKWAAQNKGLVGGVIAAVVLIVGGITLREYMAQRKEGQASELLAAAVADQRGRVAEKAPEEPEGFHDPTPMFKTAAERSDAALAKYRDVEARYPGTGAAYLARLAEGSMLLDKRDAEGASKAFTDVKNSPLANVDAEVRGRALEGLGFAAELKAQGGNTAALDEAAKIFRELENTDVKGFKELGMYHQARVAEAKGDKDKAKELLKSVRERANKPGENHPFPYLEAVADDRLRALDPTALPPKPAMSFGGPTNKMTDAQMRRLMEQMQKQMKDQGGQGGHPGEPPGKH